jgi:hypothetical protein
MPEPDIEDDELGEEFVVSRCLRVQNRASAGGRNRSWVLPHDVVKDVEGKMFVMIAARISGVRALITHQVQTDERSDQILAKTNVIEQLTELKNVERYAALGHNHAQGRFPRTKGSTVKKMQLPEVAAICGPDFGDVKGLELLFLLTPAGGKGHGLWVELNPANITYMCKAVEQQFSCGLPDDADRQRLKRKRHESESPDGS